MAGGGGNGGGPGAAGRAGAAGSTVAILCPGSVEFAGGVGRCVATLMREVPRADAGVRYMFLDTRGSRSIALSPAFFATALARLAWNAALGRVDIVHANLSARGSTLRKLHVALLARAFRLPLVLHLHDGRFDAFHRALPPAARRAVRWMFRRADRVIVLGPGWKAFVEREFGLGGDRVAVIGNAVPAPPPARTVDPPPGAPVRLLFLGRLWAPKGVSELLRALALLGPAAPPWEAALAGDGDPAPYQAEARRLGIDRRVRFPGWQDRAGVERLLGEADALVLPSHVEGLPMAVLEALAHRVPVVAAAVGSLPEYLVDGDSALLVPPRDAEALARALAAVVGSPGLRARLAERGAAVHREHFDAARAAEKVAALYRRVAAAGTAATRGQAPPEQDSTGSATKRTRATEETSRCPPRRRPT